MHFSERLVAGVPAISFAHEIRGQQVSGDCPIGLAGEQDVTWSAANSKEGSTIDEFLAYVSKPDPAVGSSQVVALAEAQHRIGSISREQLAAVRAGFDQSALEPEDYLATGLDKVLWQEWLNKLQGARKPREGLSVRGSVVVLATANAVTYA